MTAPSASANLQRAKEDDQPEFRTPFDSIALAFSGGGFRAASFSLGVLSYLNKVYFTEEGAPDKCSLLQRVTYLSSASGGTIASALYALSTVRGQSFEEYYAFLHGALEGEELLTKALDILTDTRNWKDRPSKSHNIINSFALAYDRDLFRQATIGDLCPGPGKHPTHLEEVCFNATEFFRGLLFRQQVKMKEDPKEENDQYFQYGNFIVHIDKEAAQPLRLGDVLAASSCFPAGFEPIVYPDDFIPPGMDRAGLLKGLHIEKQTGDKQEMEFLKDPRFGLMDGGITDNQGLESMMKADTRRRLGESGFRRFDLMLVNDVGSHFMDPYKVPPLSKGGQLNLKGVVILSFVLLLASLAAGYFAYTHPCCWLLVPAGIFFVLPLVFLVLYGVTSRQLHGTTASTSSLNLSKSFGPGVVRTLSNYLRKTSFRILKHLLKTRVSSVLILNSDVFLKRIRQLLYSSFYESPQWKNRGKGNHVYDLSFTNDLNRQQNPTPGMPEPSRGMQIVAENAFLIGTTLWFDHTCKEELHALGCLVACGQFTTCYNLLEYIKRLRADKDTYDRLAPAYRLRVDEIEAQLAKDFEAFRDDPFLGYNRYGAGVKNFRPLKVGDIPFPKNFAGIK